MITIPSLPILMTRLLRSLLMGFIVLIAWSSLGTLAAATAPPTPCLLEVPCVVDPGIQDTDIMGQPETNPDGTPKLMVGVRCVKNLASMVKGAATTQGFNPDPNPDRLCGSIQVKDRHHEGWRSIPGETCGDPVPGAQCKVTPQI